MAQATKGDVVKVHYKGSLNDGSVFDSSEGRDPLEFTVGSGQVIAGFDDAVTGMSINETRTVKIPAENAYGTYQDDMRVTVKKTDFPPGVEPAVGHMLQIRSADGQSFRVQVLSMTDTEVVLDGNHPLAGKDLTFDITLVEIA